MHVQDEINTMYTTSWQRLNNLSINTIDFSIISQSNQDKVIDTLIVYNTDWITDNTPHTQQGEKKQTLAFHFYEYQLN